MFDNDILECLGSMPVLEHKVPLLAQEFARVMGQHDWSDSFHKPQVIYFEDIVTSEILMGLHRYLRTQCADITNVVVIVTSNLGVSDWWREWCRVFHERSFQVLDWPISHTFGWKLQYIPRTPPDWHQLWQHKSHNLHRLFSFYGGTYAKKSRCWMTLKLCHLAPYGYIDYVGTFCDQQGLVDYVENLTYFMDQAQVDLVRDAHTRWVTPQGRFLANFEHSSDQVIERIVHQGTQWKLDQQCFFSVARETEDEDCFATISEKTFRSLCHFMVPLHAGYQVSQHLERMGFWLPHDLVDFGYQSAPQFRDRVDSIVSILEDFSGRMPELQRYFVQNQDKFMYNAQLALQLFQGDPVDQSVDCVL